MSSYPIIFLTGHRKSGTSMFHRLFDGHSQVCCYPVDISIFYAYFPCFTNDMSVSSQDLRNRLGLVVRKSMKKLEWWLVQQSFSLDDFVKDFVGRIQDEQLRNRALVLDALRKSWLETVVCSDLNIPVVFKETSQAGFFEQLRSDFPALRMVSVIRDPRDNYAALKAGVKGYYSRFGEDDNRTLASLLNRVRFDLKAAEINQKLYPKNFLSIRFEDLVEHPQDTMEDVSRFLGISFEDAMLRPTFLGKTYKGNNHDGVPMSGISKHNLGRWEERISEEEAMIIEYWLKDVMKIWGYDMRFPIESSQKAFSDFYTWYNCEYFYHDTFYN